MKRMFYHSLFVKNIYMIFFAIISTGLNAVEKHKPVIARDPIDSLLPMLGGLIAILVVIFSLAYLFKKFSSFNIASQNIRVLETQTIGHKEKIMIVQVREQQFLIGVTGHSINQLGELAPGETIDPKHGKKAEFSASTNMAIKNKGSAFARIMSTRTYTKGKQKPSAKSVQEAVG